MIFWLKNCNLSNFYQILFASIFPVAVFIPIWLPILTHLIAGIFLLEMTITQLPIQQIFKQHKRLFYAINIFSLICFLSVLTSMSHYSSLRGAIHITHYINLGFLMYCGAQITNYKTKILKGLWIGFVIGLCLGFIETQSQGLIRKKFYDPLSMMYKYNKFTSVVVLLLPLLWISSFKKLNILPNFLKKNSIYEFLIKSLLTIFSIYLVFNLSSDTSKLTIIIDLLIIALLSCNFISFKFRKILLQILLCLFFLAPPSVTHLYKIPEVNNIVLHTLDKASLYDRLSIWEYVESVCLNKGSISRTLPQQILGYGVNSSKLASLSSQPRHWLLPVKTENSFKIVSVTNQGIPLHPHNFILQIWLELGCMGVLAAFIALNTYLNYSFNSKFHYSYVVASTLSLFNFMTVASMGYGIWQSWWLSAILIALTISKICQKEL